MKPITAVLINPSAKSFATVTWDQELDSIYKLLRCSTVQASTILTAGSPIAIWMDEEYWMRNEGPVPATLFPQCFPIAGRILVTGENDGDGGVESCPLTVDELAPLVRFGEARRPW